MGSLSFPSIFFLLISSAFLFLLFLCPFYGSFYVLADGFFLSSLWIFLFIFRVGGRGYSELVFGCFFFLCLFLSFFLLLLLWKRWKMRHRSVARHAQHSLQSMAISFFFSPSSPCSLSPFSFSFRLRFFSLFFFFCRRIIFFCWLCVSFFSSNRICTSFRLFESFFLRGGDSIRFYWVLLGFAWVLLSFTEFYWVLLGFTGFHLVLLGFTGLLPGLVKGCLIGFYRVLRLFTEFYWDLFCFMFVY